MGDSVSMSWLCSNIICVALNFYLSNLLVLFFHGGPQVDWVVCDRNRRPWKGSLGLEGLEGLGPGCTAQVCRQTQTELQYMIETWCQSDFKTRHYYYTITEFSFRPHCFGWLICTDRTFTNKRYRQNLAPMAA